MHGSHLAFRYWFIAIHLLTSTKNSFSAVKLQRQLGHKRYEPIGLMLHKLRASRGKRDALYELTDVVELDEGFFTTEMGDDQKDKPLKRGRGSQRKTTVVVMAESKPIEGEISKTGKPRRGGHLKMIVVDDLLSETIDSVVTQNINEDAIIDSDDSTSYTNVKNLVKEHRPKVISKNEIGKLLPWVDIAISNAKRMLLNTFHDLQPQYLQNYLNEYCYKFNRRYFGECLFDRLMIASVSCQNQFRR